MDPINTDFGDIVNLTDEPLTPNPSSTTETGGDLPYDVPGFETQPQSQTPLNDPNQPPETPRTPDTGTETGISLPDVTMDIDVSSGAGSGSGSHTGPDPMTRTLTAASLWIAKVQQNKSSPADAVQGYRNEVDQILEDVFDVTTERQVIRIRDENIKLISEAQPLPEYLNRRPDLPGDPTEYQRALANEQKVAKRQAQDVALASIASEGQLPPRVVAQLNKAGITIFIAQAMLNSGAYKNMAEVKNQVAIMRSVLNDKGNDLTQDDRVELQKRMESLERYNPGQRTEARAKLTKTIHQELATIWKLNGKSREPGDFTRLEQALERSRIAVSYDMDAAESDGVPLSTESQNFFWELVATFHLLFNTDKFDDSIAKNQRRKGVTADLYSIETSVDNLRQIHQDLLQEPEDITDLSDTLWATLVDEYFLRYEKKPAWFAAEFTRYYLAYFDVWETNEETFETQLTIEVKEAHEAYVFRRDLAKTYWDTFGAWPETLGDSGSAIKTIMREGKLEGAQKPDPDEQRLAERYQIMRDIIVARQSSLTAAQGLDEAARVLVSTQPEGPKENKALTMLYWLIYQRGGDPKWVVRDAWAVLRNRVNNDEDTETDEDVQIIEEKKQAQPKSKSNSKPKPKKRVSFSGDNRFSKLANDASVCIAAVSKWPPERKGSIYRPAVAWKQYAHRRCAFAVHDLDSDTRQLLTQDPETLQANAMQRLFGFVEAPGNASFEDIDVALADLVDKARAIGSPITTDEERLKLMEILSAATVGMKFLSYLIPQLQPKSGLNEEDSETITSIAVSCTELWAALWDYTGSKDKKITELKNIHGLSPIDIHNLLRQSTKPIFTSQTPSGGKKDRSFKPRIIEEIPVLVMLFHALLSMLDAAYKLREYGEMKQEEIGGMEEFVFLLADVVFWVTYSTTTSLEKEEVKAKSPSIFDIYPHPAKTGLLSRSHAWIWLAIDALEIFRVYNFYYDHVGFKKTLEVNDWPRHTREGFDASLRLWQYADNFNIVKYNDDEKRPKLQNGALLSLLLDGSFPNLVSKFGERMHDLQRQGKINDLLNRDFKKVQEQSIEQGRILKMSVSKLRQATNTIRDEAKTTTAEQEDLVQFLTRDYVRSHQPTWIRRVVAGWNASNPNKPAYNVPINQLTKAANDDVNVPVSLIQTPAFETNPSVELANFTAICLQSNAPPEFKELLDFLHSWESMCAPLAPHLLQTATANSVAIDMPGVTDWPAKLSNLGSSIHDAQLKFNIRIVDFWLFYHIFEKVLNHMATKKTLAEGISGLASKFSFKRTTTQADIKDKQSKRAKTSTETEAKEKTEQKQKNSPAKKPKKTSHKGGKEKQAETPSASQTQPNAQTTPSKQKAKEPAKKEEKKATPEEKQPWVSLVSTADQDAIFGDAPQGDTVQDNPPTPIRTDVDIGEGKSEPLSPTQTTANTPTKTKTDAKRSTSADTESRPMDIDTRITDEIRDRALLDQERKKAEERARIEAEIEAEADQALLDRERRKAEERARIEAEIEAEADQALLDRERRKAEERARIEAEIEAEADQAILNRQKRQQQRL